MRTSSSRFRESFSSRRARPRKKATIQDRRGLNMLRNEQLEFRNMLAAGMLDPSFGDGGIVITDLARPSFDTAIDVVAHQSTGAAIVLANSSGGVGVTVVRYNSDGIVDGTFGDLGVAQHPRRVNNGDISAVSIAVDAHDRILVGGRSRLVDGTNRILFAVSRFTANGALDATFGSDGYAFIDLDGLQDLLSQVTVDSAGRIVVGGSSNSTAGNYAVARLLDTGELDASFDGDGLAYVQVGSGGVNSVAVDHLDRVLVGGYLVGSSQASWDLAAVRLHTDGSLDDTFGTNGIQRVDFNAKREGGGILALDSQQRVVLMGNSLQGSPTNGDIAVARLLPDGGLDPTFSSDGKQLVDIDFRNELPISLAIDHNDRILIGGESRVGGTLEDIAVVRLTDAGDLDPQFADNGVQIIDFRQTVDFGGSVAVDVSGNIFVVGTSRDPMDITHSDVAVARLTDEGQFDTTFSSDGKVITDIGVGLSSDFANEIVAYQPDGKIVVVGHSGYYVAVVRYLEDGSRDLTFGDRGVVKLDTDARTNLDSAYGVHVDDQGRIVVLTNGRLSGSNSQDIVVLRLLDDGSLDTTFGNDGLAVLDFNNQPDNPTAMDVDSLGRIVISGRSGASTLVVRLTPDGHADPSFDRTDTQALNLVPLDVAVDSDNNIVFATRIGDDFAAVKVLDNGALDTRFDSDGIAIINIIADPLRPFLNSIDQVESIAIDKMDNVILAGWIYNRVDSSWDVGIARLTSEGTLDTLFSADGTLSFDFGQDFDQAHSVATDSSDRIIVAGFTRSFSDNMSDFAVARINTDGSFDSSFGQGGRVVIDGGSTSESIASVFIDHRDRILLAGHSQGNFDSNIALLRILSNQAPVANEGIFSVTENAASGTVIGTVDASDPDGDALSYSIISGNDQGAFALIAGTGEIIVADPTTLDYDSDTLPTEFTLQVQVDDGQGGADTALVTISVLNQASISGDVFVDTNENGLREANEPGIDGVTIELLDENGDAVLDAHGVAITAVTAEGGFYLFEDLDPGDYRLREIQPSGVDDGADLLGSLGGTSVANDVMQLSLAREDAFDYAFAEIGQQVTAGDTASIGFWQNKHGQALITEGGTELADWLTSQFGNVFGGSLAGADGEDVAEFYREQLFKQTAKKSSGPAKIDAQFMAVALATYFTSRHLAGEVAAAYGFNVTDTGIGTKVVNVGASGAAFNMDDGADTTILELLAATNAMTDEPDTILGFAHIYDRDGDGLIDSTEAALRAMANEIYSDINQSGGF